MDTKITTKQIGDEAENAALTYLQKNNLVLLERNYRCKQGEIDLIMLDKNDVVFVEVRTRNNNKFGNAILSVNPKKQKKIIFVATQYLCQKKCFNKVNCRFDVIGISYSATGASLEWIKNAFSV